MAEDSLPDLLRDRVSAAQRIVLEGAREAAARRGFEVYLVGGVVRDLLLTGRLRDLDLTVVGDGVDLARELAHALGAEIRIHERFLTAELSVGDERIDVVTARCERYPEPGALPEVEAGTLQQDLERRDFSVNAMALGLWPDPSAELVDPFGGRSDLAAGELRILHDRSFDDDPTRILRGARLGARLGLDFESATAEHAVATIAGGGFDAISGSRLRHELVLMLEDAEPCESLRRLDHLGFHAVLGRRHPSTEADLGRLEALLDLRREGQDGEEPPGLEPRWWLAALLALLLSESDAVRAEVAGRLALEGEQAEILARGGARIAHVDERLRTGGLTAAQIASEIESLSAEERVVLQCRASLEVTRAVDRWRTEWVPINLEIAGGDLLAAGYESGPEIGRALRQTLQARREGRIQAAEELDFAIRVLLGEG